MWSGNPSQTWETYHLPQSVIIASSLDPVYQTQQLTPGPTHRVILVLDSGLQAKPQGFAFLDETLRVGFGAAQRALDLCLGHSVALEGGDGGQDRGSEELGQLCWNFLAVSTTLCSHAKAEAFGFAEFAFTADPVGDGSRSAP